MPTFSSIPKNLQNVDNKNMKSRTGINSKGYINDTPKTKALVVGNYRSDYNKMYHLAYYSQQENSQYDPNAFRSRPIKHWRKQYGHVNNKQTYNNRNLIHYVDKPGGYIVEWGSHNGAEYIISKDPITSDGSRVINEGGSEGITFSLNFDTEKRKD